MPKSKAKKAVKKHVSKKNSTNNSDAKYKFELMGIDKEEQKYDKLFEEKLSEQYKEFRNLKEHHMQSKRFLQIFIIILVIILIALLVLTYS